jgi:SAM-dependent methyltransferase
MKVAERDHWERVYGATPSTELGWYEREPSTSLRLIEEIAPGPAAAVIDVGAGTSSLVNRLLADGFTDVTVLDISHRALAEVRRRLDERAPLVTFLTQDVLSWTPQRRYDIWHDRAVFHFLTEPSAREQYVEVAARAIDLGGHLVLGTFGPDGPTQCSGLPVCGYSPEDLNVAFSPSFALVEREREEHITPSGVTQPFTWVVLRHREQSD